MKKQIRKGKTQIYGIYSVDTRKVIYVNVNKEELEFEFDISDYNKDKYLIVTFDVTVS